MRRIPLIIIILLLSICGLQAQNYSERIVRLHNGTEIVGEIVEQIPTKAVLEEIPGETITIRTTSGDLFVYRTEEILEIIHPNYKAYLAHEEEARMHRLDSINRVQQEREAAERAAERAKTKAKNEAYNKQYRNRGVINSVAFSFIGQVAEGEAVYTNLGHQSYGGLNPIEVDYLLGYRFSNWVALNLGVGFLYNMVDLTANGDTFSEELYGQVEFRQFDIPIYLNGRFILSRGKVQPMISLSAGVYATTATLLVEAGVGVNVRLGRRSSLYLLISGKSSPWIEFDSKQYLGYQPLFSPGFQFGFTL